MNVPPRAWHSLGMMARGAPDPDGPVGPRKAWADLRQDLMGAVDVLVVFHLDDVVLYDGAKLATVPQGLRLTLFDHLLAIRNRDTDPTCPHFTKGTFDSPKLTPKDLFALGVPEPSTPTVRRDLSTRLISLGHTFYDIEEQRVTGTPGKTSCLGARCAVANHHPIERHVMPKDPTGSLDMMHVGCYEIHLIAVPGVLDPLSSRQLLHMLLYISCTVDLKGASAADLYTMLHIASERWSQGSPGVATPTKDYRIVSKDEAKRTAVIRPRAFFGPVPSGAILKISVDHPIAGKENRSNTSPWDGVITYYASDLDTDVQSVRSGDSRQDSDNVAYAAHILTHEFGHALGLPDEYGEFLNRDPIDPHPERPIQGPDIPAYLEPKEVSLRPIGLSSRMDNPS